MTRMTILTTETNGAISPPKAMSLCGKMKTKMIEG